MTSLSKSNPWNLGSPPPADGQLTTHDQLLQAMRYSRALTLRLFDALSDDMFRLQAHADFSPVGWHLGHIGYTESRWILEHLAGQPCAYPQYRRLFAADGLPKHERQQLPEQATIVAYLADIRSQVEAYLGQADLTQESRLWHFLLQHESQHCETIAIVLALLGQLTVYPMPADAVVPSPAQMIHIPAGGFWQGDAGPQALDNEQPPNWVELPDYWIDATPVTCAQYQQFIQAGGYQDPQWWSLDGWQWCQQQAIQQPHYWRLDLAQSSYPVCGVSWYEATAYARFVANVCRRRPNGKRRPAGMGRIVSPYLGAIPGTMPLRRSFKLLLRQPTGGRISVVWTHDRPCIRPHPSRPIRQDVVLPDFGIVWVMFGNGLRLALWVTQASQHFPIVAIRRLILMVNTGSCGVAVGRRGLGAFARVSGTGTIPGRGWFSRDFAVLAMCRCCNGLSLWSMYCPGWGHGAMSE